MINRSSAAAAAAAAVVDGGNIVVLSDHHHHHPSSKTKKRRSSSRSSFMLPFVLAFASLALFIRILRPTNAIDDTLRLRSDGKPSLQESYNTDGEPSDTDSTKKNKRTPKHKFPKGWKNFSYDHIRRHFNCEKRSKDMNKPLPSLQDWELLRQTYTRVVGNNSNHQTPWTNDVVPPTLGYSLVPGIPIPPPYYAKQSPGKGRGLFASRPISKGELVHNGQVSDVTFPNAILFREFVFSLPRDYACDVVEWVWMQQLEKGGEYHLHLDMSISALMNSGGADWGDSKSKTVNAVPKDEYSGKFYATRDIKEGEEILTDYDVYYTKWSLVGLDGK